MSGEEQSPSLTWDIENAIGLPLAQLQAIADAVENGAWMEAHDARIASEAAEAEREAMNAEWRDYLRALWIVANRTEGGLRFSAREFLEVPDDLVLMISDDIGSFDKVIRADRLAAEREGAGDE